MVVAVVVAVVVMTSREIAVAVVVAIAVVVVVMMIVISEVAGTAVVVAVVVMTSWTVGGVAVVVAVVVSVVVVVIVTTSCEVRVGVVAAITWTCPSEIWTTVFAFDEDTEVAGVSEAMTDEDMVRFPPGVEKAEVVVMAGRAVVRAAKMEARIEYFIVRVVVRVRRAPWVFLASAE